MPSKAGNEREPGWQELLGMATAEVQATVASLPPKLRREARRLPVTFEPSPSPEMLSDGIEPDALGLFLGEALPDSESGSDPLPAQVVLFLESLWDFCEQDEAAYREEIRATFLHELGHYLGLDETDLEARGLD